MAPAENALKRLTHTELTAASLRSDWATLWDYSQSTVKLVVGGMARNGAIRAEDAEDMEQEGMLIAGQAVRKWRPLECALSTHVGNAVRWGLIKVSGKERNHGIGSYEQRAKVLSLGDARDAWSAGVGNADFEDEDESEALTFDGSLTYEGVIRRNTGQFDGSGTAPEGFGDPADEADRVRNVDAVRIAAVALRDTAERNTVTAVLLGEHPDAFAARTKQSRSTVYRRLASAQENLRLKLQRSAHKGHGSKECT